MTILQARAIVKAKDGQWEEAQRIASRQVSDANTRPGTLAYEIYVDEANHQLINLAAYRDADSWLAHTRSNPFSTQYMQACELVSLEVHGEPTHELLETIRSFGCASIYPAVSHG
jgi:quinol monooxygenase YgiN